jgi:hypothetical protein
VNVTVAEQAVERYYTTVSRQQITDALVTLTTGGTGDQGPGRLLDPVQVYQGGTDELRRLLNHALFRRLYLADSRITNHEPWPTTPLT